MSSNALGDGSTSKSNNSNSSTMNGKDTAVTMTAAAAGALASPPSLNNNNNSNSNSKPNNNNNNNNKNKPYRNPQQHSNHASRHRQDSVGDGGDDSLIVDDTFTNLMVRDLDTRVEQPTLEAVFAQYGEIVSCAVMRDIHTAVSLGTAFVRYATHEEAQRALVKANGTLIGNRVISVQWARKQAVPGPTGEEGRARVRKLLIRNIPVSVTAAALQSVCEPYGCVGEVSIHRDTTPSPVGGEVRRIAFVVFGADGCAAAAAAGLHNTTPFEDCHGVSLMVKLAAQNFPLHKKRESFTSFKKYYEAKEEAQQAARNASKVSRKPQKDEVKEKEKEKKKEAGAAPQPLTKYLPPVSPTNDSACATSHHNSMNSGLRSCAASGDWFDHPLYDASLASIASGGGGGGGDLLSSPSLGSASGTVTPFPMPNHGSASNTSSRCNRVVVSPNPANYGKGSIILANNSSSDLYYSSSHAQTVGSDAALFTPLQLSPRNSSDALLFQSRSLTSPHSNSIEIYNTVNRSADPGRADGAHRSDEYTDQTVSCDKASSGNMYRSVSNVVKGKVAHVFSHNPYFPVHMMPSS